MHSFVPYLVRVTCGSKNLNLSAMKPAGTKIVYSIFDIFSNLLNRHHAGGLFQKAGTDKVYKHSKSKVHTDHSIHGLIECGEFGYSQDIVDIKTGSLAYNKKKIEAGLLPFFIRLAAANKPHFAVLISQKTGTFGVKTHLYEILGRELQSMDPSWVLRIEKIVPAQLVNKYLTNGEIKSVRFISHEKPSDIADSLKNVANDDDASSIEFVIKARRGKTFGSGLLDLIRQQKPVTGLLTIPNMTYDEVKVDIEINGKRKTIDLTNMHKIGGAVDVTNDMILDNRGHPTIASLIGTSDDLIQEIRKQL